jgi:ElaB/YqjD/DUF883 family membrane-anchored ribosome-binding protein
MSLLGLVRALTGDTRTFVRQEIQLAKTELSEKLSHLSKNAISLAVGGAVAYAGLIVFLMGIGWLLSWAFQAAGLKPELAAFVGFLAIGLVVIVTGCILLLKAAKSISRESLAPQRTMHTLQELKGSQPVATTESRETPAPSSEQMQARVEATESRMGETLEEVGRRLNPAHINAQIKHRIQEKPYQSGVLALGAGLVSGLWLFRKGRRAAA